MEFVPQAFPKSVNTLYFFFSKIKQKSWFGQKIFFRNAMPSMNPALVNSIRQMKRFKGLYAEPNKQDSSKSKHNKAHHNKKVKAGF